jgi:hypothetical protein
MASKLPYVNQPGSMVQIFEKILGIPMKPIGIPI